ncbi:M14 family metallopeptidase [Terrimonas sp. NA20]|uniref:M14 family metallopeptidase n=1 Tax=Terrimonas ginsenosidimutans TaxID=2908004 RepID=A0ABS9KTK1_9BACT|nr:M14 family metallopeptidase [Terrimonas ginsenosidimutans]MCG2615648.1 M14 family metallopeptidase [Terrimonas ginsenosidimutans]
MRKIFSLMLLVAVGLNSSAQSPAGYSNFAQQTNRLNTLAKTYPQLVKLRSLTKTAGGKEIWQITIGTGNVDLKPALLVAGGVEGNNILSTELALGFAEDLLKNNSADSIKALLAKTTFYVFPNLSPDAMEQYFAALRYERQGNATSTDDDRDGKLNEDGFDDLDGNGKITIMRVESPVGTYKTNPDDTRMLVKADLSKGEKGLYDIYTEGRDNDNDGNFNEDGEGGVWFNKNLTFKHPSFSQGSGEFPVSENETRALLDYLFERSNIYAVVSFGSNNNLSSPVTFNQMAAAQTITSGWLEPDAKINSFVSDLYNKETGLKDAPKASAAGGDFYSWAYFHFGRYSFSTPGWWVPKAKADTTKKEKAFTIEDPNANYLRWAASQGISNTFTEWKAINHPDFPGRKVEVGGIDPFVLITPPYNLVADITKKHNRFLVKLASAQPELDLINVKTEKLNGNVTRITVDLVNKGALPSHSKLGERNYWVKRIRVKLNTGNNQSVISGRKLQTLNALDGYGTEKLTWLIKGSGKVTLEAGSPTTGSKTVDINL